MNFAGRIERDPFFSRLKEILSQREPQRIPWRDFTHAAVLIPMWREGGRIIILFTRRSQNVRHHKGEVSFPGGVMEPQDQDLSQTALREAHEEVGIAVREVVLLGRLDEAFSLSRFSITPFVGALQERPSLLTNQEVAEPLPLPLERLLGPDRIQQDSTELEGTHVPVLTYQVGEVVIWGATARILANLLDIIRGDPLLAETL